MNNLFFDILAKFNNRRFL